MKTKFPIFSLENKTALDGMGTDRESLDGGRQRKSKLSQAGYTHVACFPMKKEKRVRRTGMTAGAGASSNIFGGTKWGRW